MSNAYGIDFGTGNLKIFSKASNDITNIKDTICLLYTSPSPRDA